jgi:twitching motility protein PilJ
MSQLGSRTSDLSASKSFLSSVALLALAAILFSASIFIFVRDASHDAKYLEYVGELRVLTHQISTSSHEAVDGDAAAFISLKDSATRFSRTLDVLTNGDGALPGAGDMMPTQLAALAIVWQEINRNTTTIVANRDRVLFLNDVAKTLSESIPDLQHEYENVIEILLDKQASAEQLVTAQKQMLLAERIARNVDKMIEGNSGAQQAADQFNLDASVFGGVLDAMLNGSGVLGVAKINDTQAKLSLKRIERLFGFVSSSVDDIFSASPDLLKARDSVSTILKVTPQMLDQTNTVADGIRDLSNQRSVGSDTAKLSGLVLIITLAIIGYQLFGQTKARLAEQRDANDRNQIAIQRLLSEIGSLADGDLTAEATVSEDFTGAIADSINFTVEQLREIVSSINGTTVKVNAAAKDTQDKAMTLAEASNQQASQISDASASIKEMAGTMGQMSVDAFNSATVAKSSVEIAKSGSRVVQNTIDGMDTIREQIQDTSKRIKRLGESSQEIGDIVSLINDIADQTNILALNASIQASMAGEAGRGFAVVADEVQRLAERSSGATKQIEALVRTIQSDTNEAVSSMEQTTAEVVTGAGLAHDAGVALEEIEKVSSNLSQLIETISTAAKDQAEMAGNVSGTMNSVKNITKQTATGTTEAATKMGTLSDMTIELRDSVAGFKLPASKTKIGSSSSHVARQSA